VLGRLQRILVAIPVADEARHIDVFTNRFDEVFDALVLLAAGELTPAAIRTGYMRVQELMQDMTAHRQARLEKLGFDADTARRSSALHTRNFMSFAQSVRRRHI
jgi:hypothetical protein